ncbi:hypothetical protein CDD83_4580 [Cordyceps sp. RAO-2017]|nr:hypothetical protein CDD83_4580 [Cordyceps sp. RAO-2017]
MEDDDDDDDDDGDGASGREGVEEALRIEAERDKNGRGCAVASGPVSRSEGGRAEAEDLPRSSTEATTLQGERGGRARRGEEKSRRREKGQLATGTGALEKGGGGVCEGREADDVIYFCSCFFFASAVFACRTRQSRLRGAAEREGERRRIEVEAASFPPCV